MKEKKQKDLSFMQSPDYIPKKEEVYVSTKRRSPMRRNNFKSIEKDGAGDISLYDIKFAKK